MKKEAQLKKKKSFLKFTLVADSYTTAIGRGDPLPVIFTPRNIEILFIDLRGCNFTRPPRAVQLLETIGSKKSF